MVRYRRAKTAADLFRLDLLNRAAYLASLRICFVRCLIVKISDHIRGEGTYPMSRVLGRCGCLRLRCITGIAGNILEATEQAVQ
eukprot:1748194-Karenia_brevis.AAC.1